MYTLRRPNKKPGFYEEAEFPGDGDSQGRRTCVSLPFDVPAARTGGLIVTRWSRRWRSESLSGLGNAGEEVVDADDDGPSHPGCVYTIQEEFEIKMVGCGNYPWDGD